MVKASNLCKNIKNTKYWDQIFVEPAPRLPLRPGYRINITNDPEEEIEKAKEILKKAGVIVFEDREATSYSNTVRPGERTLRIVHAFSVMNLKKMWEKEEELEKSSMAKSLKEQSRR